MASDPVSEPADRGDQVSSRQTAFDRRAPVVPYRTEMRTVQLGKGWFSEESGGLNRYYADLLAHLPHAGVGVKGLVAGSDNVPVLSNGAAQAFAPIRASLPVRLSRVRARARDVIAQTPGSLAVAHFALYAAPCLSLLGDRPLVMHFHGPWAEESRTEGANSLVSRMKRRLELTVYRRATRFIVLSRAFQALLVQHYGVPEERIAVIPGGVDVARFSVSLTRCEARDHLGWPSDRRIVLVVRRLVRRMGLENLIASVKDLRNEVPDVLVLIAGTGPLADELDARCSAAGLDDHVRRIGYVRDADLPIAYRAADLSIVPSVALEGFGLIVAESLAAGTPVLVTPVGGLPETLEGFSPQCITRGHEPRALGEAIADALSGRVPMPAADACRAHALRAFDWSAVATRVRCVYSEALR